MTGMRERMLDTGFSHVRLHYTADPEKDDVWARRLSARYGGMDSPKWRREFEIDYTAVEGQRVYPMLSNIHVTHNLHFHDNWALYRVIDHGIRHPMVCLWVAVNRAGDRHVYREYYSVGKTIEFNCMEVLRRSPDDERIIDTLIDPAVRQRVPLSRKDNQPVSTLSLYNQAFGFSCRMADNSRAGYDAVRDGLLSVLARKVMRDGEFDTTSVFAKEYFQDFKLSNAELLAMGRKPSLTFEQCVPRCYMEMRNLRFKDISGDATDKAQPEEIMDKDDDGPDCVRYAMQTKIRYTNAPSRYEKGSHLWSLNRRRTGRSNPRYVKRN
tara:strand:- start:405 stop:1376 length:972 start_codon:yes stop_codon:yes gene_type:complete